MFLKRVKAHAIGVNHLLYSWNFSEYFADFQITRIKADASHYIFICLCYVTIRSLFEGSTLKNRLDYFIDNLIKIWLLDAAEAASDVALDIACDNLTFHEAGL